MDVPLYSSCVLYGCLVLFFNLYTIFTDQKKKFTTFQSHLSTSTVTLSDGLTSRVLGSEIIHLTLLITLTYVMSLPQFYFNLI